MNKKSVQYFHHGILAIIALLYSWATIFEEPKAFISSTIIGFGTYFIYRLAYYQPIVSLKNLTLRLKIKPSLLDIFLLLIACIIAVLNLNFRNLILLSTIGFLSGFYFLMIQHPTFKSNGIRKLPFIKNVFLALMWTTGSILLPIYFVKNFNLFDATIPTRFVYILITCVAVDLRDVKADIKAGTLTLPTWIGFNNTKLICFILLAVYFALISRINLYSNYNGDQNALQFLYYGTGIILGLSLIYIKPNLERSIYTKLFDGCLLLQAVGLIIISALKIG